jgi:acetyl-CoA synthetase
MTPRGTHKGNANMSEVYPVPDAVASAALIDNAKYLEMYEQSVKDPEGFWGEHGKRLDWIKPYTKVKNTSYDPHNVDQMVRGRHAQRLGQLRGPPHRHARRPGRDHLGRRRPERASGDHLQASSAAREQDGQRSEGAGVKKGDRVTLYLPMIPEAAYAMLACARLGAVHSIVFGGFSPDSLAHRIEGCDFQGGRSPPMKACAAAARCR